MAPLGPTDDQPNWVVLDDAGDVAGVMNVTGTMPHGFHRV